MTIKSQKVDDKMKMTHKLVRKDNMIVSEILLIQKCKLQDPKFREIEIFGAAIIHNKRKELNILN
jgi:hypothetical protein